MLGRPGRYWSSTCLAVIESTVSITCRPYNTLDPYQMDKFPPVRHTQHAKMGSNCIISTSGHVWG